MIISFQIGTESKESNNMIATCVKEKNIKKLYSKYKNLILILQKYNSNFLLYFSQKRKKVNNCLIKYYCPIINN